MTRWNPNPIWQEEDCYIIGGGPSLQTFDWGLIRGKHAIGCNVAYQLGPEICPVMIFGDARFWAYPKFQEGMKKYAERGGVIFTNLPALRPQTGSLPWVYTMGRLPRGLATLDSGQLGWNGCTGASAINLALVLGAENIYLLGYDMQLAEGKANWHQDALTRPNPSSYDRFIKGFVHVVRELELKFPGRHIVNVNDNSRLELFPKQTLAEHFAKRNM
jgi:hypothetical protein